MLVGSQLRSAMSGWLCSRLPLSHDSSEQRMRWLMNGLKSGQVNWGRARPGQCGHQPRSPR
jgi:hypothetical protein